MYEKHYVLQFNPYHTDRYTKWETVCGPYPEWSKLVSGLMDDTPLGRVVAVRSEKDPKVIAQMNSWQRKIRADWFSFVASKAQKRDPEDLRAQMASLERMLANAFGGGTNA